MVRLHYHRLSLEEKEQIRQLTSNGKSLRQIQRLMGLGITTIYYQVRKFKPKMHKDFNVGELTDFEIGELMGAFAGDGSFYHKKYDSIKNNDSRYRTRYHLSLVTDINYLNYLSDLLKKMNLNPIISHREEDNSIVLNINSKDFYKLIREYLTWEEDKTFTIRLLKPIQIYSEDFLRGFARGLMDTDGFLNEGNAGCACISEELINNLAGVYKLYNFDISRSRIIRDGNRRPIFYIRVLRKSLKNFGEKIGFSNSHKREKLNSVLNKVGSLGFEPRSQTPKA